MPALPMCGIPVDPPHNQQWPLRPLFEQRGWVERRSITKHSAKVKEEGRCFARISSVPTEAVYSGTWATAGTTWTLYFTKRPVREA
jgi:hypothetical protein